MINAAIVTLEKTVGVHVDGHADLAGHLHLVHPGPGQGGGVDGTGAFEWSGTAQVVVHKKTDSH